MSGRHIDGRRLAAAEAAAYEIVVVGSGPAGAAVARAAAQAGARVAIVEAGPWVQPAEFAADGFSAMARYYRSMGASLMMGRPPMPFIQGRLVGGSSVINGAIHWRLPRDVYDGWVAADPGLGEAHPWAAIEAVTDQIERDLNIHPTPDTIAGPNNLLLGAGAEALGLEHRPISRNVRGCRGLGRCLQGCPEGHKQSMDQSYLPEAIAAGADLYSSVEVGAVQHGGGRATGVVGRAASGACVQLRAGRAVVLAASAVQTPALLIQSGLRQGPVGEGFMGHPGASVAGRFREPVRMWAGATQGHEVIGLRQEGIKFEALGFDAAILATRLKGTGRGLARELSDMAHWADWGAAIRAEARGRVRPTRRGGVRVALRLSKADVQKVRRGVAVLGEMMLAAGAEAVFPGVYGWAERVTDRADMQRFAQEGPLDPNAYMMAVTHMFGTCRMGTDPRTSVVGTDFRHHGVQSLYVADSSVFPTNTGVNPQSSILALATRCGQGVVA